MSADRWTIIEPGDMVEGSIVVPASVNWPLEVEIKCKQRGGFGLLPISDSVEWRQRPLRRRERVWGALSGHYHVVFDGVPKEVSRGELSPFAPRDGGGRSGT